ncbi:MAG: UDP-N-acetyl glucosamine 2-epimerase, partial [Parcubacteria group bacterium]
HYDHSMSGAFFDGLPTPDVNLGVGSAQHGEQTGAMLRGIEADLIANRPDMVLVYGDTNSTLAGALAAAKLGIPIAHVEAGLRSFMRSMPEEINRIVADSVSDLLLCPTETGRENLEREGRTGIVTGDVMKDAFLRLGIGSVERRGYVVATIHRAENTDDPARLAEIIKGLGEVGDVIFPLHPRTAKLAPQHPGIRFIEPLPHEYMLRLVAGARLVITDSGGLKREAYWLRTPSLIVRPTTEYPELVDMGWATLVEPGEIADAAKDATVPAQYDEALFGDGHAAERIVSACSDWLASN